MKGITFCVLIVMLGCSLDDDGGESPTFTSDLSFVVDNWPYNLSWSDPNKFPSDPKSFQLSVSTEDGVTTFEFQNPNHVNGAPCFSIRRIDSNGNLCGFIAFGNEANLCTTMGTFLFTGDTCRADPGVFNASSYDQRNVYAVTNFDIDVTKSCREVPAVDPVTGQKYIRKQCTYEGTFTIDGKNAAGQTVRLSKGKYKKT